MSGNYEHDQERLLNTAANALQTAVSVGAQLWMNRTVPLKVEIRTAAQDVQSAHKAITQGTPRQEIFNSIRQGEAAQRVALAGGDPDKYAHMMLHRAEIDHAVEIMPAQAPSQAKTPKKSL